MALSKEFTEHLEELFAAIDGSNVRAMFGGAGIFRDGIMYVVATSEGRIALKADDQTINDFKDEGCEEWTPHQKGRKPVSMGYWYMPERFMDDDEEREIWARKAFDSARRIDAKKPPSQRKFKG